MPKMTNKKTSYLWKFFEEIGNDVVRCKLCGSVLRNNMARHLQCRHNEAYELYQELRQKEHVNIDRYAKIKTKFYKCGWLEKYMNKLGTGLYQCNICFSHLKMPQGLYGNMKRHFHNKHPEIYATETGKVYLDSNTDIIKDTSNVSDVGEDNDAEDSVLPITAIDSETKIDNQENICIESSNAINANDAMQNELARNPVKIEIEDKEEYDLQFVKEEPVEDIYDDQ